MQERIATFLGGVMLSCLVIVLGSLVWLAIEYVLTGDW